MLTDWHTHIWLPDQLGSFGRGLDEAGREYGLVWSQMGAEDDHDRAMAQAGIEQFVVLAMASDALDLHVPNTYVSEFVASRPGRAIGVASVDPNDPGALEELRRCGTQLGLRGLKLSPPYQGFDPQSPEAWAIYELAAELGLFLIFHQGAVFHPDCSLQHANPILLDPVAAAFPAMPIIVAHFGQPWIAETVTLMARHPNVWADVSARLNRPWQLYNALMACLDYGVTGKVLFGSDFPVFDPLDSIRRLRALNETLPGLPPIPDAVIEGVLDDRPLTLLGLDPATGNQKRTG